MCIFVCICVCIVVVCVCVCVCAACVRGDGEKRVLCRSGRGEKIGKQEGHREVMVK